MKNYYRSMRNNSIERLGKALSKDFMEWKHEWSITESGKYSTKHKD